MCDKIYAYFLLFAWCKPLLSQFINNIAEFCVWIFFQLHVPNLTNDYTMISNRIIDKTFEEIDSFSKLIITLKIFKQEKKIEPCKTTFSNLFKSALFWPILMHFEKKNFFSKVRLPGPKFQHTLWKKNSKCNFSGCVVKVSPFINLAPPPEFCELLEFWRCLNSSHLRDENPT